MGESDLGIVKEIIKANAVVVYKDAAQPSIRVIGKSLAQCVSLFATPIGRTAQILEKNIIRFLTKLEGIPESQLISPDTRVLVPILEKMRYIEDEKVAEYYAEILACASKRETKDKILLSFIEILNRITADEIRIIEYINSSDNNITIDGSLIDETKRSSYDLQNKVQTLSLTGSLPVIGVRIETEGKTGFKFSIKNFNLLNEYIKMDSTENTGSYLENLISLGLLEKPYGISFAIEPIYDHLENHSEIKKIKAQLDKNQTISFERYRLDSTDLCRRLLSLCSKKEV